jgi:hypothetical protein
MSSSKEPDSRRNNGHESPDFSNLVGIADTSQEIQSSQSSPIMIVNHIAPRPRGKRMIVESSLKNWRIRSHAMVVRPLDSLSSRCRRVALTRRGFVLISSNAELQYPVNLDMPTRFIWETSENTRFRATMDGLLPNETLSMVSWNAEIEISRWACPTVRYSLMRDSADWGMTCTKELDGL